LQLVLEALQTCRRTWLAGLGRTLESNQQSGLSVAMLETVIWSFFNQSLN